VSGRYAVDSGRSPSASRTADVGSSSRIPCLASTSAGTVIWSGTLAPSYLLALLMGKPLDGMDVYAPHTSTSHPEA
jgi:hypothetical protein